MLYLVHKIKERWQIQMKKILETIGTIGIILGIPALLWYCLKGMVVAIILIACAIQHLVMFGF